MKKKIRQVTRKCVSLILAMAMLLPVQGAPVMAMEAESRTTDRVGSKTPKNPVHHCTKEDDGTDTTDWSYVYFGSYPQTEVVGDALTAKVTGASYDANGDAWVDGTRYRRISKSDTNYDGYFGSSAYRYFKWERIRWRVLKNDGDTLFVVADKGLDCEDYNKEYKSTTWENCMLRSWVNNKFYNAAFTSSEQGAIVRQKVVNEDNPYYHTEGGNDTRDYVFMLSINEAKNPEYGFCGAYSTHSVSRLVKPSDYAHARGVVIDTTGEFGDGCWWWLRSPGEFGDSAALVNMDGDLIEYGYYFYITSGACVPALYLNLSSDLWTIEDNGDSDSGESGDSGRSSLAKAKATLKQTSYTYDGKSKKPGVSVKLGSKTLSVNKDYKLTYQNNKKVGTASVTITGIGNYTGSLKKTFKILPKGTSIYGTVNSKSKGFAVKWKKQKSVTGYQVQYSTDKNFKNKKATAIKTVKKNSTTKLNVGKLKANQKYYVRIRTYQTVKGKKYESAWSKPKTVRTKR